jgi:predicted enzyme related to lactoylglutathione lyase
MQVGDQGRMAVFQDPSGAFLGAWQPMAMSGFAAGAPGGYRWAELNSRGFEAALPFYAAVFGWVPRTSPMGEGQPPYTEFLLGDESVAGGMEMSPMVPDAVPSYWMVYFSVADVDASFKKAIARGAREMVAPQDFPGGRFAIVADPQGAVFGALVSPARTVAATPSRTAAPTRAPSSATGGPVARGGNLCSLLGPGDFTAAGVAGASAPTVNSDENGGRYCVYAGTSGATGGIEFDAFTGDPVGTYQTIAGETGTLTELAAADLPGADQAGVNLSGAGGMAAIVVRKGQLIFDMSFPRGPQARAELIALSALVMERAAALE